jgi:hypothetical protein
MEKEQELRKLTRVLRSLAKPGWQRDTADAAEFCRAQYNKTLARVVELEPAASPIFTALPAGASLPTVRLAARELYDYLAEDEPRERREHRRHGCRPRVVAVRLGAHCG